jgi:hypothetical protein
MTGPRGGAVSSRRGTRPILIKATYLFEAGPLLAALRTRSVKIGVATSLVASLWDAAEVFPRQTNPAIQLTAEQREALSLFSEVARSRRETGVSPGSPSTLATTRGSHETA